MFIPGPTPNTVRAADGRILTAPEGWILLLPGDAALTRRVKEAGEHWVVAEKKGRKVFSRGVWAPATTIERIRADLEAERATEGYAKRKESGARRREKAQADYVRDFFGARKNRGQSESSPRCLNAVSPGCKCPSAVVVRPGPPASSDLPRANSAIHFHSNCCLRPVVLLL